MLRHNGECGAPLPSASCRRSLSYGACTPLLGSPNCFRRRQVGSSRKRIYWDAQAPSQRPVPPPDHREDRAVCAHLFHSSRPRIP
jgi:hypothetical protein